MLALVLVHGVFWSGLLSSSSAYVTEIIPASRRAEGLGYSGFASILAVAVAPWIGLWVFDRGGWTLVCLESAVLNVIMAILAWRLPPDTASHRVSRGRFDRRSWSSGASWWARSRCSSTRSATAASRASSPSTPNNWA